MQGGDWRGIQGAVGRGQGRRDGGDSGGGACKSMMEVREGRDIYEDVGEKGGK